MNKVKYIKTKDNRIIVFSDILQHKEFKHFNPVSAGFIDFFTNKDGTIGCLCYGESISLGLKSEDIDTELAMLQILNKNLFS